MKDISSFEKTLTRTLNEELLPHLNDMPADELKSKFIEIVHRPELSISTESRKKYEIAILQKKSPAQIQFYVCNVALKGSGLGVI
jgi:hypothetical protein